MPKRPRSPDAHPAKRSRPNSSPSGSGLLPLFELDEVFLRVLGNLEAADLARAQAVSRRWATITVDPQLWKRLYLARYPHPHHHVSRSTGGGSTPMRPLARRPSRAFPPPSPSPSPAPEERWEEAGARHDGVDWKLMMRLGTNWANGAVLAEARVSLPPSPASQGADTGVTDAQRIALFPSFVCSSSPTSPLVHVYAALPDAPLGIVPPPPGWSSPNRPDCVTAIAADQAVAAREGQGLPARLVVLYASGGFAVVRLRLADGRLHWSRETVWARRNRPRRRTHVPTDDDPVVLASLHHPVLVTCTRAFVLSVYSLAGGEPELLRSLRSDVSFHPASLAVFPPAINKCKQFRAALTYTAPVYPSSWTVSVQELQVDVPRHDVARTEVYSAIPPPEKGWPRHLSPLPGVRRPVGIGGDGRWCVLAGDDSVIHVYAMPRSDRVIRHAQTLLAPSAGVAALALEAGRCVSGGRDGRVLVWNLDEEGGEGVEGEARVGGIDAVEVCVGGRRQQRAVSSGVGSQLEEGGVRYQDNTNVESDHDDHHPTAISHVARGLFLAKPPATLPPSRTRDAPSREASFHQLALDEAKVVGLLDGEVLRVWLLG